MKTVTIVHMKDLVSYPPVLSLIQNLLYNGHRVHLISYGIDKCPKNILENALFDYAEIPGSKKKGLVGKINREFNRKKWANIYAKQFMKDSHILWTTTDISVRTIPEICEKFSHHHVMQLMELEEWYPRIVGIKGLKFPIDKYARNAWKMVVPEINRAHIQQTWWQLENTPYILPNKPYSIDTGELSSSTIECVHILKNETRKVVLYLGIVAADRHLDEFADAIASLSDEYALYIAGRVDSNMKTRFEEMVKTHKNVIYLGSINAPEHLALLKYAYIGLTPYYINVRHEFISPLNVQYCAPNKIYEYAGYGVPMIGTNVLGLMQPFDKFQIGLCCRYLNKTSIVNAIKTIQESHEEMSKNCLRFFDEIDLDGIVGRIIEE